MFEYTVTFYEVEYTIESKGKPWQEPGLPSNPDASSLLQRPTFLMELQHMGKDGWEMVSTQPLLRGVYHEGLGLGYSLTAGYYIFWKRKK